MARQLRIIYPGAFYHVFSRGNNRQAIFLRTADYRGFLQILSACCRRFRVRVYAFCLMPNHYHLFLETVEPTLSVAMRHVNGVYTQRFNRRHARVGHLLQGRFKAKLVDRDTYGLALSRYIHLNPCRAGLARLPEDYRWSSVRALLGLAPTPPWLIASWTLAQFGVNSASARAAYRQFLMEDFGKAAEDSWEGPQPAVLGHEQFVDRLKPLVAGRGEDPELPEARQLFHRPSLESIVEQVAGLYGQSPASLRSKHGRHPARAVAMFLAARMAGSTHQAIGAYFGAIGYSAVSQCLRRIEARRLTDGRLDRRLHRLESALERGVDGQLSQVKT